MALTTEFFYLDKGAIRSQGLMELERRVEIVEDISFLSAEGGKTLIAVTYELDHFFLTGSSPPDGVQFVAPSTSMDLTFNEELSPDSSAAAVFLETFRNGTLVPISGGNISISNNRVRLTSLIDGTAGAYYQVILKSGLLARSKRTLGADVAITFKTA